MVEAQTRPRRILQVDVDAMFVQCAMLADPERLASEPLILVGGTPSGRGVVTSASYGCREYGVRSAMSTAAALRLCPKAVVVPVPGKMIRTKSRELAAILHDWAPVAMMASVDEAYLDLSGTEALYHHEPLENTARRIQLDVKRRSDLGVSIGGGTNRLVAKLATARAKPAGVCVVAPGGEDDFVARLKIEDLIGVGPSFAAELRRRGISSMRALRALDLDTMRQWWGDDRARWLWRRCRGIDESRIAGSDSNRTISSETTFRLDTSDLDDLEKSLLERVVDVAGSLRKQELYARTITVKLRDRDFHDRSRSRTVREPVQTDRVIFAIARELLGDLRRQYLVPARLIGVGLSNLSPSGDEEQFSIVELAPPLERPRDRAVSQVLDRIRAKHGRVIGPGRVY